MADVLLINRDDIMSLTGSGGSVDTDRFLPHIKTAQDMHLQPVLGTDLLNKLLTIVGDDTWEDAGNEAYATLITSYVTPFLVYYTMVDFLPFQLFQIENAGVYRRNSDNAIVAEKDDMQMLVNAFRSKAEFHNRRINEYLCNNTSSFAEYTSNSGSDMHPDSDTGTFQGLQI